MLKRFIWVVVATLFFAFQVHIGNAAAVELDESVRTVKLNDGGEEVVLSVKEVQKGQRLFNSTCSECHMGGRTKTNPNITLALDSLAGSEPSRDNIMGIVDYMKHPLTYDGQQELSLLHPNTERTDLYPEMRSITDDDLKAIAGYILMQPKIRGASWGGGKVYQ